MSSIAKYELLKKEDTWANTLKYILSLSDKSEIENYLKKSSLTCYDDLRMLLFLLKSTKNDKYLLEVFKMDSLPVKQRTHAGKAWIKLQKDEKQVEEFVVQTINEKNVPRYLKHEILKSLHRVDHLKRSNSFFYDLACRLTELNNHDQYNLDSHLVPFCSKDEIFNLLSRWSLKRLQQIDSSSSFRSKLIRYQPLVIIHLIKGDLNEIKKNNALFSSYFKRNNSLFELLVKKETKALCQLTIEYLNQLEKGKRLLPQFIQSNQKFFFRKAPDQMIEIITIVASNQPGIIKYQVSWFDDGSEISSFEFPRSFSVENSVRLFLTLYETCKWSSNNTYQLIRLMLQQESKSSSISEIKKREKWFLEIIVKERIGKDLFIKKLLKDGNESSLSLLAEYSELTTPISEYLISQYERNGIVEAKKRLSLIRYQRMTEDIFNQFLSLFKQTGSDVNQRTLNYPLFLQCAKSTNEEYVTKVFQWIQKRFTNEQLAVIEHFLSCLSTYNSRFQLEILPNNFETLEAIIDIAFNHLQRSTNTLQIISNIGITLLQRVEHHTNKQRTEQIQSFASKIIKRCISINDSFIISNINLSVSYPKARNLLADILISDSIPKLLSKSMIDQLNNLLNSFFEKPWLLKQIDSFTNLVFTDYLPSSTKLQSAFQIDTHEQIISLFLKNRSTRFERVKQLIHQIDTTFFLDENVQRIAVRSQQHQKLIDKLIEDDKCVTLDKFENEQSKFVMTLKSKTKNIKLPGLNIDVLNSSCHRLTGKQQEHITQIILNDYLQDKEVSNLDKLKSLRILRRLTHTYNQTLRWLNDKQGSPLASKGDSGGRSYGTRGANAQSLDDIIQCLPATFDLTPDNLLKYLDFLKTKLNSGNAKYISDAMLSISRKITDEIFLKNYLEFVRNEQFEKLGITANKEILRLLIQYVSDPTLIESIVKPLWDSKPHQDVRACLILTLLHFIGKSNSNQTIIWNILQQAAIDEYLPVIQSLFVAQRGESRWPLTPLKNSSDQIFQKFVNQIQFQILDHPTSLEARSFAWAHIDIEHCDTNKLVEKAQQLCIQFDKDGNTLWESAFTKIISSYHQQQISSLNVIIDIIKKVMSRREEVDSKENAIDNQHDLPVYHRIQRILKNLISNTDKFDEEDKLLFRSLTPIILQFDKTLSTLIGTLLIKVSESKENLEEILKILQENLSENYFERVVTELSKRIIDNSYCPFVLQLNLDDKLNLAQWFIIEKNRGLFVLDLLLNHIFNESGFNVQQSQLLIRHIRNSENLFLRQQALEYTVPWNEDGNINQDDDQMSVDSGDSH